MKDFTADAESRLGVPAVKAEKTLCGNDIDIIGYTNDTSSKNQCRAHSFSRLCAQSM